MMRRSWLGVRALLAGAALVVAAGAAGAQGLSVSVTPDLVTLGTFAADARLRVEGTLAAGAQAVVVIAGSEADETFNRKGRFGPIWVSAGKVHVTGVPAVLLVYSGPPVESFLPRSVVDGARLDEAGVGRQLRLAPAEADQPAVRAHYLGLKRAEGTYQFVTDAVRVETAGDGRATYVLDLAWPKTAPPASYRATVFECRDGAITRTASLDLAVRQVGLAAFLRGFADDYAPLYGVTATVLMMGLGFGIDFLVARIRRARARRSGQPVEARVRTDASVH
jgi:hypothetical protein